MSGPPQTARSVDEVLDLFGSFAQDRYDEDVTQLEHALQTAALAVADGATDPLVAAALLHDVGHLLSLRDGEHQPGRVAAPVPGTVEDLRHEARGARWLAELYPPAVTRPIALHVAAKRYICSVDAGYAASLSTGSRASLVRQGGPMDAVEVARFEANPGHADAVRLRRWDDSGKRTEGVRVAPLAEYRPLLERLAGR